MPAGPGFFRQTLAQQTASGTLFNTFTTAKSVINPTELVTLPPNFLRVGSVLEIDALLGLSNIVTTPGTFAVQIMLGSVIALTSGNVQLSTTANTLSTVEVKVKVRVDAVGVSPNAKLIGRMKLTGLNPQLGSGVANPTVTDSTIIVPTTPADGTGFDSTLSEILDFWVGFSSSQAGNGVQVFDYTVEMIAGAL